MMTLSYTTSRIIELLVCEAWGVYERWYLHGAIDADKFMKNPRHAVDLLLAPYVYRNPASNNDEFIASWVGQIADICSRENATEEDEMEFLDLFKETASYLKNNY